MPLPLAISKDIPQCPVTDDIPEDTLGKYISVDSMTV